MKKSKSNKRTFYKPSSVRGPIQGFKISSYYPVLVLFAIITAVSALITIRSGSGSAVFMSSFMGGFFVSFSFFKILNIRGFANSYAQYDILASRSKLYAIIYPFIELTLGLLYVAGFYLDALNIVTIFLMLLGLIGISNSIFRGKRLSCACLGTVINVPLSVVSFSENLLMAIMALCSLLF